MPRRRALGMPHYHLRMQSLGRRRASASLEAPARHSSKKPGLQPRPHAILQADDYFCGALQRAAQQHGRVLMHTPFYASRRQMPLLRIIFDDGLNSIAFDDGAAISRAARTTST